MRLALVRWGKVLVQRGFEGGATYDGGFGPAESAD